jgi:type IV secretory pathway component VirB8
MILQILDSCQIIIISITFNTIQSDKRNLLSDPVIYDVSGYHVTEYARSIFSNNRG